MPNRLRKILDSIAREQEAPIYALERLRWAVSEDRVVDDAEAARLEGLNLSGEGRAFGSGWLDFLGFAMSARAPSRPLSRH